MAAEQHDFDEYKRPGVAVDVVIFTIKDKPPHYIYRVYEGRRRNFTLTPTLAFL